METKHILWSCLVLVVLVIPSNCHWTPIVPSHSKRSYPSANYEESYEPSYESSPDSYLPDSSYHSSDSSSSYPPYPPSSYSSDHSHSSLYTDYKPVSSPALNHGFKSSPVSHSGYSYTEPEVHSAPLPAIPSRHTFSTINNHVGVAVPQPVPIQITRHYPVPIHVAIPIEIPRAVQVAVPHAVPVDVPRHVPVGIPRPVAVPVQQRIPVQITQPVGIPVPQAVPVNIPVPQAVAVPQAVPYAVPQAVHVPAQHIPYNYGAGFFNGLGIHGNYGGINLPYSLPGNLGHSTSQQGWDVKG